MSRCKCFKLYWNITKWFISLLFILWQLNKASVSDFYGLYIHRRHYCHNTFAYSESMMAYRILQGTHKSTPEEGVKSWVAQAREKRFQIRSNSGPFALETNAIRLCQISAPNFQTAVADSIQADSKIINEPYQQEGKNHSQFKRQATESQNASDILNIFYCLGTKVPSLTGRGGHTHT